MKPSRFSALTAAFLVATLPMLALAGDPEPGLFDFGKLMPPGNGGQFVEVNVSPGLLGIAATLTSKQEPEVSDLIRSLKSVRVNVIGLDDSNREALLTQIQKVRTELEGKGWERVVTVNEKGQDVGVYIKHRGEEAIEGVVVTVLEPGKEAVFINVVGDLKPEKIALLGEKLNIAPLSKLSGAVKKS
ncbi:MAG: DUF4252 domain-containing protein [Verrucomicrobiales bacterium]|nr:DUF4252 domain-containing protein [Verrucomicrobiales bacterium]